MNQFTQSLLCGVCLLATLAFDFSAALANDRKPNVIVILADDLGYGDLSCYAAEDIATPNIDRMATEGAKFNSFYVSAVWGFNTVGWVQEVTVRKWRHSRAFTIDEYRALDMPYCHLLPFTESHQWEKHTVHYDFRSNDWKEWADYVARSHCAELSDERNLIGYFYSDCPTWTHSMPDNEWRGPIFDPESMTPEELE
ncbi:sulfatase-like hydrolase/transferase [Stieleria mannarensis]|uniref:sulfatase-like hydrolase/transferase n=1 Tax=Stieleria mannarensis TaxID=2755585 RepID=UPI003F5151DD